VSPLFSSSSPRPSLQQYPFSSLVSLSSLSRLSLCHHLPPSLPPPSSSVKVFFSDRRCSRCREASMVAVLVRGNGKFSGFGAGSSGGRNTSNESCGGSSSATPFARFGFLSWFVLRGGSCPEHLLSCCDVWDLDSWVDSLIWTNFFPVHKHLLRKSQMDLECLRFQRFLGFWDRDCTWRVRQQPSTVVRVRGRWWPRMASVLFWPEAKMEHYDFG